MDDIRLNTLRHTLVYTRNDASFVLETWLLLFDLFYSWLSLVVIF
mgnify:CR=1 FL=1